MPPLAYAEPREYFSADARLADGGWMLNLKRKGQVTWPWRWHRPGHRLARFELIGTRRCFAGLRACGAQRHQTGREDKTQRDDRPEKRIAVEATSERHSPRITRALSSATP
jgi:hypothetical protein